MRFVRCRLPVPACHPNGAARAPTAARGRVLRIHRVAGAASSVLRARACVWLRRVGDAEVGGASAKRGGVPPRAPEEVQGANLRPVSLSMYGDPEDPRYAVVLHESTNEDCFGIYGVTVGRARILYDILRASGYRAMLVSAIGSGDSARLSRRSTVWPNGASHSWPKLPRSPILAGWRRPHTTRAAMPSARAAARQVQPRRARAVAMPAWPRGPVKLTSSGARGS